MSGSDPVVFVVDDDPNLLDSLKRLLFTIGLAVTSFSSAEDFLDHDHPNVPSCLVLDVRMPGMSGLNLQQEMSGKGIDIPIIFMTGHGDIPMAVRAMKAGAVDFLQKPFNNQQLLDAVQRALEHDRGRRAELAEQVEIRERVDRLTKRESEVLSLVVTGMLNKQIAFELGTSEKTIKVHRSRVMEKMEAESLADLVRMAGKVGIHGPEE